MTLTKYVFMVLLIFTVCCTQKVEITGKVVQIQPVALDVILSIYDRAVVLFTHGISTQHVQLFQSSIKDIIKKNQDRSFNSTLFAVCDIDKDQSGKLKKFGNMPSIQLITPITHYELRFKNSESLTKDFFDTSFIQFIQQSTSSRVQMIGKQDISSTSPYNDGYLLFVTPSNTQTVQNSHKIHKKIFDYLKFFNTSFAINKAHSENYPKVDIYHNGELYSSYAQSAVEVLFNFTNQPAKSQINDLVDFINVETIDDVTQLTDKNYFRVFGSSIQHQILFVYRQQDQNSQQIIKISQQFKKAAQINRKQGLKYQRILFATGTTQFLKDYFADNLLQNNQKYQILITKTQYTNFQLRKFVYPHKQITAQQLVQFISDVRFKRIDADYKSQQIQDGYNDNRQIRKIVGNNFYNEIFQQSEKSVMVLFIDSKDINSSNSHINAVEQFVKKYYDAFSDKMNVGIFDLGKNQHKALTISNAPELILFQRTNKKKPKFFKGRPLMENIKNWVNYQIKDITIPQNFGQPPIALGGGSAPPTSEAINNQL